MKLETFFNKFDQFADAPDAVAKMRELVLLLAVQGKLVDQLPSDEPATKILERIQKSKERLIKERAIRRQETEPIDCDSAPFPIPQSWVWTRLGEIGDWGSGSTPPRGSHDLYDGGITWLKSGELNDNLALAGSSETVTELALKTGSFRRNQPGDVLFAMYGATIGKAAILAEPAVTNQAVCGCTPFEGVSNRYLFNYLVSQRSAFHEASEGGAQPNLSKVKIVAFPFPLPPLAEQKRIVAKVDELMALCDRLEAQQQERETRHAALARASLARFADAPTPANLPFLFHPSYAIPPADLRKSILTLAVQGKLAPQDPNDEPSEDSLARNDECRRKTASSDHRADEENQPLLSADDRWDIADTWSWRGLADLFLFVDYRGKTPAKLSSGVRLLTAKNVRKGQINLSPEEFLSESEYHAWMTRGFPKAGDVLFTTEAPMGNAAVVELTERFALAQRVICFQSYGALDPAFLVLQILSDQFQFILDKNGTGVTAKGIKASKLKQLPIAVPPLAEQKRIVATVEQLMALVDALETQLAASRATAANLLSALVAELTGTDRTTDQQGSLPQTTSMKSTIDGSTKRRSLAEPLQLSTRSFVLRRFAMTSGYRSLDDFDCTYHEEPADAKEASPICLVGLNGSGKSNLIEAIAEVFCFLELINMPWQCVASDSSTYRKNRHMFELEYTLEDADGERRIRIKKTKQSKVDFLIVDKDGNEKAVAPGRDQLSLLPRRIIGYSSGLNETVSHPFLRTKTLYSQEVRDAAPQKGVAPHEDDSVYDTRTLYMDYESNAAIIISNYIFRKPKELSIFEEFTRVRGVNSFGLRFNRKRAGRSGEHRFVRLTSELSSYLISFARCAGVPYDEEQIEYKLHFPLTSETTRLFQQEFKTAETLFMAMHKWSLLNALVLSDDQRNVYLSSDITKGALERPPSVPPSDRVFDIVDLKLNLSEPAIEIDYSGLSDGEHQFMQVFGTVLLFSQPGALFLFDEPESHFNPEWRTKFNLILNGLPHASLQEYIISTHSPFVVSGSRKGNVYKFTRKDADITFSAVDFETYGAAFDVLLKKLFSIDSLIDQSARQDLEQIIKRGKTEEMEAAVENFAESREKRRLYEAIIKKEEGK